MSTSKCLRFALPTDPTALQQQKNSQQQQCAVSPQFFLSASQFLCRFCTDFSPPVFLSHQGNFLNVS